MAQPSSIHSAIVCLLLFVRLSLAVFGFAVMLAGVLKELDVFADGSFHAGRRSGGWAFVVIEGELQVLAAHGSTEGRSNNSLEVLAVLQAMSWITSEAAGCDVTLWTDSIHVIEGCRRWLPIWRNNGWKQIDPNPLRRRRTIPDVALWRRLDLLLAANPNVGIEWCKGHSAIAGNDRADTLARRFLGPID